MIKIYTYSNPYHIDDEFFWQEIKNYPQLCVSQTLVNGLNLTYPHFADNKQLTTIRKFVNSLYQEWDNHDVRVKQIIEVDNAISFVCDHQKLMQNIKRSLLYNTNTIVNSIRIFSELGLKFVDFDQSRINDDQKLILSIYNQILENPKSSFSFERKKSRDEIEQALLNSFSDAHGSISGDLVNLNTVVIHGIHQFNPAILCAIEDLSQFKNVILLFNYQNQYKSVYETWLNIYTLFEEPIIFGDANQYLPNSLYLDSYKSNILADSIGKVSNGDFSDLSEEIKTIDVVEFENNTEFANYCAMIFENALNESKLMEGVIPPLALMKEQFYSPSKKVNDILRAYFPEQFGERHFLDYPIGHFFVAAMNMWDDTQKRVTVNNYSDIKECLQSGIISEKNRGELLNTFNNISSYFENETILTNIIKKINNLKKYLNTNILEKNRIGYFSVTIAEVDGLLLALGELNNIIVSFFEDFDVVGNNFKKFYNKIQKFIISKINDMGDLDSEMLIVIKSLVEKLDRIEETNNGTFTTLKNTMSYFLSQNDNVNKGANWIVRGFEQIDGDILRSNNQDPKKTKYHFCCLSDKDICANSDDRLPWPLDISFFEYAQIPLDWKYRIFLKSKMEYRNFNRYALLYGLEFNRSNIRLSYVKADYDKDNELYHIIKLLGLKIVKYKSFETSVSSEPLKIDLGQNKNKASKIDLIKASICPYRYAIESLVQNKTIFRERFLIHHYMRSIILKNVLTKCEGTIFNEKIIHNIIIEEYDAVSDKFKLYDELEKLQLVASVFKDIKWYLSKGKFPLLSSKDKEILDQKLDFLMIDINEFDKVTNEDIQNLITSGEFETKPGNHCTYCSSKDICLAYRK